MPSPRHKCANPDCDTMIARKEAIHCKKHVPRTKEWIENQAKATTGRKASIEQRQKISTIRRKGKSTERKCLYCTKSFNVSKPSQKNAFCSKECGYKNRLGDKAKNWNGGEVSKICIICDTVFVRHCKAAAKTAKVCSYKCNGILQRLNQKNKKTKIEILFAKALTSKGISFDEQKQIKGICIPDFFIPSLNAVVFCDGEYWHSLEHAANRDIVNSTKLNALGFSVFRYMEMDILSNPDDCVSRMLSHF